VPAQDQSVADGRYQADRRCMGRTRLAKRRGLDQLLEPDREQSHRLAFLTGPTNIFAPARDFFIQEWPLSWKMRNVTFDRTWVATCHQRGTGFDRRLCAPTSDLRFSLRTFRKRTFVEVQRKLQTCGHWTLAKRASIKREATGSKLVQMLWRTLGFDHCAA